MDEHGLLEGSDLPTSDAREPLTRLDDVRSRHNVVAAYPDLITARRVIESLERAGVEGEHISLLGAQPARSDDDAAEPPGLAAELVPTAAAGTVAGAVLGGIAGATALAIPGLGPVLATGVWASVGGAAGGIAGAMARIGASEAWDDTFASLKEGNVCVGVHGVDPGEIDTAEEILRSEGPKAINRFGGVREEEERG